MKRFFVIFCLVVSASIFTSCAVADVAMFDFSTRPQTATGNTLGTKVGTSSKAVLFGIAGWGDGGIDAAAKNGGIKKISHVDVKRSTIMGVWNQSTTIVYGE